MSFENLSTIRIILGACGTQTDAIEESFKMLMTQSLSSANFAIIPGRALVGTSLGIKKKMKSLDLKRGKRQINVTLPTSAQLWRLNCL